MDMKRILMALVLVIAMCGATYATDDKVRCENDSTAVESVRANELIKTIYEAGNIVSFYNVDKLYITNNGGNLIIIYDYNWKIIYQSHEKEVNLKLKPGDYHVVSNGPIQMKYFA